MSNEALKTAVAVLIKAVGGPDAASTATRVVASNLSEYQARHLPKRHMPVDVVADLEAIAERPIVTAALARAAGFGLAMDGAAGDGCEIAALGQMVRAAGELSGEAFEAAADARVDDAEGARIMRTIDKMRRAMGLFAALMGRRKAGRQ